MKIKKDKVFHFFAGVIIAFVVLLFGFNSLVAVAITSVFAAVNQVYDYFSRDRHTPDFYDFLATFIGGALVVFIYWVSSFVQFPYMLFVG